MRIVILTQNAPFFIAESLNFLIENLPGHSEIVGCVIMTIKPFLKKKSFLENAKDTYNNYGFKFFTYYSTIYALNKFNSKKRVNSVLSKHNIPTIKLEKGINSKSSIDLIKAYKPDLLISIDANQIFKKAIIDLAPKGCLNVHGSLLPKYRGRFPSFWVLKHNEKETGVTVFFVDEGIDSGPIIVQKRIDIPKGMTQKKLIETTKRLGMEAIIESVNKIESGKYELIPNPDEEMSYYSGPEREDVVAFLKEGKNFF